MGRGRGVSGGELGRWAMAGRVGLFKADVLWAFGLWGWLAKSG